MRHASSTESTRANRRAITGDRVIEEAFVGFATLAERLGEVDREIDGVGDGRVARFLDVDGHGDTVVALAHAEADQVARRWARIGAGEQHAAVSL